jgi:hypothetical protein
MHRLKVSLRRQVASTRISTHDTRHKLSRHHIKCSGTMVNDFTDLQSLKLIGTALLTTNKITANKLVKNFVVIY